MGLISKLWSMEMLLEKQENGKSKWLSSLVIHLTRPQKVVHNGLPNPQAQFLIGQDQTIFFKTILTTMFVSDKIWVSAASNTKDVAMRVKTLESELQLLQLLRQLLQLEPIVQRIGFPLMGLVQI